MYRYIWGEVQKGPKYADVNLEEPLVRVRDTIPDFRSGNVKESEFFWFGGSERARGWTAHQVTFHWSPEGHRQAQTSVVM